jgi:Acyltransferase family
MNRPDRAAEPLKGNRGRGRLADMGEAEPSLSSTLGGRVPPRRGISLRHAPGLDGIRALAVCAVVAYHLGTTSKATVLPGGFLGVDIFFVLSGYLITSLLVVEAQQSRGRISIKQFYLRRARRLLPALFALLLVVGAVGAVWLPYQAARLRGDLVASLTDVTNGAPSRRTARTSPSLATDHRCSPTSGRSRSRSSTTSSGRSS